MARFPNLTGEALSEAIAIARRCKADGRHALEPIDAPADAPVATYGVYLFSQCERCGSIQYRPVNRHSGMILGPPKYIWPDWYQQLSAEGYDRSDWRALYWATLDDSVFGAEKVTPIRRRRRSA